MATRGDTGWRRDGRPTAGRRRRCGRLHAMIPALFALGVALSGTAASASAADGTPSPDGSSHVAGQTGAPSATPRLSGRFADDSFWYRRLPDDTPTAPDSEAIMDHLVDQAETHFGSPGAPGLTVNLRQYSPTMYVADESDPRVTFVWENCQDKPWGDGGLIENHLTDVRIPEDAVPADGSDQEMVVYDAADDRLVETWGTQRLPDGTWSACWGGSIEDVAGNAGLFEVPFGVSASGLPLLGGTIRAEELAVGRIEHVVGIAVPFSAPPPTVSSPATRTDGVNPSGRPVTAQGQMLRLPADLDLDAMLLSPTARAIAEAAQDYGLIVWDTAGAVSFRAENPLGMANNPYPEILRGRYPYEELAGDRSRGEVAFPFDQLVVLPVDYAAPAPDDEPTATASSAAPARDPEGGIDWAATSAWVAGVLLLAGLGVLVGRRAGARVARRARARARRPDRSLGADGRP